MSIADKLITWRVKHLPWYEQRGVTDINITHIPNNSSCVPVAKDFRIFFICNKCTDFNSIKNKALSELSILQLENIDIVHATI